MIKYAIRSEKYSDILIFHALPNEITKFQWYISESTLEKGSPIEGELYESYSLLGEMIKENNYVGKYLYCEYLSIETKDYNKTEYIKLETSIDRMISEGAIFDDISEFDKKGNIIKKEVEMSRVNVEKNFIKKLEEEKFKVFILEIDKNEVIVFSKDNNEWITVESRYWEGEYWYHWGVPTRNTNNMVTIGIGLVTKEVNLDNVNEMIEDQYGTYNEELETWKINDIKELNKDI